MDANKATKARSRKTVIYAMPRPSGAEEELRANLELLDKILASYERTVEGLTRVLLPPEGEEEHLSDGEPP